MPGRLRRLVTLGWWPALLVALVAGTVVHRTTNVAVRDEITYALWFLWACTLPGTLLWRLVDWRRPVGRHGRPLLEDLVLGSILGIAAVVPVHLATTALGVPLLVLAWPVPVVGALAATRRGRDLLLSRQATPSPLWWSWGLGLLVLFVVVWSARANFYGVLTLTPASLVAPYVDEPYHQSLVAEFAQHFPAQVPYVDGTPLRYHWLVYPFLAAGVVGSGVETVPLLRVLAPFALSMLLLLGVAVSAARMSGHRWAALGGVVVLCLLSPLDAMGWSAANAPWMGPTWATYLSPTQAYASALCPLVVVMLVGIMRGAWRGITAWVVAGLMLLAIAGAKSAMIPLFVAGLSGTVLVLLVLNRRIHWRVAGLAALSLGAFVVATVIFYGTGSRAVSFGPFQLADNQALALRLVEPDQPVDTSVQLMLTLVYVLCGLVPLAAGIGLFVRGGWRRPTPWVLLGCLVSALGVVILFRHPSFGQVYFRYSAVVPATLLAALGWARAVGRVTRRGAVVQLVALVAGLATVLLVAALSSSVSPGERSGSDAARVFGGFLVPIFLSLGVVLALAIGYAVLSRRTDMRAQALPVAIAMLVGLCLPYPIAGARGLLTPGERAPATAGVPMIRPGGIEAATWLRDHSTSDQLVATNVHTRLPGGGRADARSFWISAWTERHVLVQGWAYVEPTSVGLPSTERTNRSGGAPFWDQRRLALNDEVFSNPTEDNLRELREKYGVDWLFVDRFRNSDVKALRELVDERYRAGAYAVFRLDDHIGD